MSLGLLMNIVLSVIVCTYNRYDLLLLCLKSLAEQTLDRGLYEVIIVNNNSTDCTHEIAESFAGKQDNFRVVVEKRQGHSHARNCGWREASGKYVAYIDDDAKAAPDWCERIFNAFESVMHTPAAVGGQIFPYYEVPPPSWFSDNFEIRTWGGEAGFLEQPRARYGFSGSNMAFQRRVLELFGGFSDRYGIVNGILRMGEDTEFFYRIYDNEPNFWYDPAIIVYHWTPRRNFAISYRFKRNFRAGEAAIQMQQRRMLSAKYTREFVCLLTLVVTAPYRIAVTKGFMKTEVCRLLQEIGYKCGFLFGRSLT